MSSSSDPFAAVADPTRRRILDLLRLAGPMPAGSIAVHFPFVTREAISRHVRVLLAAGLVAKEERGREVWYAVDPTPLREVHLAWLLQFAPLWEASLAALRDQAERPATKSEG